MAWVVAGALQQCTFSDSLGLVELQEASCNFAKRCKRFDNRSRDPKVIRPLVQTRVKKANHFSRSRVNGRHIGTLVTIAEDAAKSQIVQA